jgi:hypothetical protein
MNQLIGRTSTQNNGRLCTDSGRWRTGSSGNTDQNPPVILNVFRSQSNPSSGEVEPTAIILPPVTVSFTIRVDGIIGGTIGINCAAIDIDERTRIQTIVFSLRRYNAVVNRQNTFTFYSLSGR